jgi:hypothetical protein
MQGPQKLIPIMKEIRAFLAQENNNFTWSSWRDQEEALSEIDSIIEDLENGSLPEIKLLFAPTGPISEISIDSGWGYEFIEIAERFEKQFEAVKSNHENLNS